MPIAEPTHPAGALGPRCSTCRFAQPLLPDDSDRFNANAVKLQRYACLQNPPSLTYFAIGRDKRGNLLTDSAGGVPIVMPLNYCAHHRHAGAYGWILDLAAPVWAMLRAPVVRARLAIVAFRLAYRASRAAPTAAPAADAAPAVAPAPEGIAKH